MFYSTDSRVLTFKILGLKYGRLKTHLHWQNLLVYLPTPTPAYLPWLPWEKDTAVLCVASPKVAKVRTALDLISTTNLCKAQGCQHKVNSAKAAVMVHCFSGKILLHVLGNCFSTKCHILAPFYKILLPLRAATIICARADLFWHQNCWPKSPLVEIFCGKICSCKYILRQQC
jgi:hypothetical protein